MAESGGDPRKHTVDSDDNSYGLWQINMLGSMGPSRRLLYGLKSNDDLYDPATNAHVMSVISKQGQLWTDWGAYNNGSYKQFLPGGKGTSLTDKAARAVVKTALGIRDAGESVAGTITDTATAAVRTAELFQAGAEWISRPKNWVRIAYVAGGGILLIAALQTAIAGTAVGKAAIAVGKKVVTKGAS
jgi:hypothetical protein